MPSKRMVEIVLLALTFSAGGARSRAAHDGVPRLVPDDALDVVTWWNGHSLNPRSPDYQPEIDSPKPIIDVAAVHAEHPRSQTAGIEEALAMLPPAGGTLRLPKSHGPYVITKAAANVPNRYRGNARIQILRRSNVHFLSDGATLRGKAVLRISSQEFADHRTEDHPVRNFYFRGLVFDADGDANVVSAEGVRDVVFDRCTFRNLGRETINYGKGAVYCISKSDNWWLRGCTFDGGERCWAFHPDGTHGSGMIGCRVSGDSQAAAMVFTNDDVDRRRAEYLVFYRNTFCGSYRDAVIGMAAAKTLILENTVEGPVRYFVRSDGKQSAFGHTYTYYGNYILGNTLRDVQTILRVQGALDLATPYKIGKYTVKDNRVTGMQRAVFEEIRSDAGTVEGPNVVANNGPDASTDR